MFHIVYNCIWSPWKMLMKILTQTECVKWILCLSTILHWHQNEVQTCIVLFTYIKCLDCFVIDVVIQKINKCTFWGVTVRDICASLFKYINTPLHQRCVHHACFLCIYSLLKKQKSFWTLTLLHAKLVKC